MATETTTPNPPVLTGDKLAARTLRDLVRKAGGPYVVLHAALELVDEEETRDGRILGSFVSLGTEAQDILLRRVAKGVASDANGATGRFAAYLEEASDDLLAVVFKDSGDAVRVDERHRLHARADLGVSYVAEVVGDDLINRRVVRNPESLTADVMLLRGDRLGVRVCVRADDPNDAARRIAALWPSAIVNDLQEAEAASLPDRRAPRCADCGSTDAEYADGVYLCDSCEQQRRYEAVSKGPTAEEYADIADALETFASVDEGENVDDAYLRVLAGRLRPLAAERGRGIVVPPRPTAEDLSFDEEEVVQLGDRWFDRYKGDLFAAGDELPHRLWDASAAGLLAEYAHRRWIGRPTREEVRERTLDALAVLTFGRA